MTPDIRCLKNMEKVIYDQEWLKSASDFELYYMYRGLEEKDGLRYDMTIIPAKMLGSEFVKTKGHYHLDGYQEVYVVLEGSAIYLMQKKNNKGEIEDVYAVKAQKGDVVIIPSYYGHVTINPSGTEKLKMANWISLQCRSDYSLYEKTGGACYFAIAQKSKIKNQKSKIIIRWVKNKNYKKISKLRFEKPLKSIPEDLNFLKQG